MCNGLHYFQFDGYFSINLQSLQTKIKEGKSHEITIEDYLALFDGIRVRHTAFFSFYFKTIENTIYGIESNKVLGTESKKDLIQMVTNNLSTFEVLLVLFYGYRISLLGSDGLYKTLKAYKVYESLQQHQSPFEMHPVLKKAYEGVE